MTFRLTIVSGEDQGRHWRVREGRNIVGRMFGVDIVLRDSKVSRTHCAIDLANEITIEDLGSLNATYVNGERTQRRRLVTGDSVKVGDTEMVLSEGRPDEPDSLDKTAVQAAPGMRKLRDFEAQLLGHGIVGHSPTIGRVLETIAKISRTDTPVLITGPTGTGKELIAFAIHLCSPRRDGPFIGVTCSALSETLLEAELFGADPGANAASARGPEGRVRHARGGTLFLDEIAEMPTGCQAKVLRLIEERSFTPVGGSRSETADCRVLAASSQDPETAVRMRTFRTDLYYRLNTVRIDLPPLRERKEDIEMLADQFVEKVCCQYSIRPKTLTPEARARLGTYEWPGNIRELQSCIERAVILGEGPEITVADLKLPG